MYCPQCLTEYREGFFECADCHTPLALGLPPARPKAPEVRLVTVLETRDSFGLTLATSALEEAGIEFLVNGDEPRFPHANDAFGVGQTPLLACSCRIQVASENEREARARLEPLQNPPAGGLDEDSEPER
jgi:hypothetical protein